MAMTAPGSALLRRVWTGQAGLPGKVVSILTVPLEGTYGIAIAAANARYDRRHGVRIEGLRVVSVGNLVVGGTGKTPLSAWVARWLQAQGHSATLLSRGYGRDELMLHARWNPDVPVIADKDRVAGAREARAGGADVAVLDDGFQHRRLWRDLDIVLLAAEDGFPGRLLPRGPYREPPESLGRADVIVVTRRIASSEEAQALAGRIHSFAPGTRAAVIHLAAAGWSDLCGDPACAPSGDVLAAAGVARPDDFRQSVARAIEGDVELIAFPDHYEYRRADAVRLRARADGRTLVVTEKDAVKLVAHREHLGDVRVLLQEIRWESGQDGVAAALTAVWSQDE